MIEVRPARLSDVPKIIPMAKDYFEESGWKKSFGYSLVEDEMLLWFAAAVKNPFFGFFLAENGSGPVGLLIGYLQPWAMNHTERSAFQMFFYVDKNQRNGKVSKRMIEAYEAWAKENGCQAVEFGVTEKMKGEKMAKYLSRLGYEPATRSHVKRFEEVQDGV